MLSDMNTIKRAIEICGGAKALADKVGVSQQAVHLWKTGSTQLLARHAAAIEQATDGQVTATAIGHECAEMVPSFRCSRAIPEPSPHDHAVPPDRARA